MKSYEELKKAVSSARVAWGERQKPLAEMEAM
jgi:hypothetical protein